MLISEGMPEEYPSIVNSPKASNLGERKADILRIHEENIEIASRLEQARNPDKNLPIPEKVGL